MDGRVRLHKVTIPEGYTQAQIVQLISASGLAGAAEFRKEVANPRYPTLLGIPDGGLEGYLFPDTYLFPRQAATAPITRPTVRRSNGRSTIWSTLWAALSAPSTASAA